MLQGCEKLTPKLTPTAFSGCNESATVGNEQDNFSKNNENDNCLNAGQLGITKDGLTLAVTGKKEKPTVGFEPTTTGLQNLVPTSILAQKRDIDLKTQVIAVIKDTVVNKNGVILVS